MGVFDTYKILLDLEGGSDPTPDNPEDKKYEELIKDLNELNDGEDDNDKVEIKNNALNNSFEEYLLKNTDKLADLKAQINEINGNLDKVKAAGNGFNRLKKFVENLDKDMEKAFNDFKSNLDNPNKLKKMNNKDINLLCAHLNSLSSDAALNLYKDIKGKTRDGIKVMGEVWTTLKDKYGKSEAFLNNDFDIKTTKASLTGFMKEDWDGTDITEQNLKDDAYDEKATIVDKALLLKSLNTANETRKENIKTATIEGYYDKYEFQKNGEILQYKLKGGDTWTTIEETEITGLDGIKELVKQHQDLVNEAEGERLLSGWSSDIYNTLLNDSRTKQAQETTDNPSNPQKPSSSPETTAIGKNERAMDERDFAAMTKALGDAMFISETKTDDETSHSYDIDKVKAYLKTCKDNPEKFTLNGTSYESKNLVRRRAWISAVQILINEKIGANGEKLVIDGKFGTDTKAKVRAFQEDYNKNLPNGAVKLGVDGIPGKDTIQVLLEGSIGDTILEGQWHLDENGGIAFDNGTEIKEENGRKYIEIGGQKYYEYRSGMNGLGFSYGINSDHLGWLVICNYKNGYLDGDGTTTFANGDKYEGKFVNGRRNGYGTYTWGEGQRKGNKHEGEWKNNKREGHGTYTYANGDKLEGEFKNNYIESGKFTIHSDGDKVYDFKLDNGLIKITGPEGDANVGKYIDVNDGNKIKDIPSS